MKHKPFEEWIFSDDDIRPAERKALYDHLIACDPCDRLDRNWRTVEALIRKPTIAAPAQGFASRWQARFEADRRRRAEKQSLAVLVVTSLSAGMFLLMSGFQLVANLPDLLGPVVESVARTAWLFSVVQGFLSGIVARAGFIQPVLPVFAVMGLFAAIGAAAILWLKMFRTLARVQGLQQWA